MNDPATHTPPTAAPASKVFLVAALLALAALAAWHGSFDGPFVFDDLENIADNPSIRRLSAWRDVLAPPAEIGVGGRPVLNLSYAVNYRLGRLNVSGYHVVNLAIHVLAAITLLAFVHRTLLTAPLRDRFGRDALRLATAVALLWMLHPIQTASVTYLSQRAESLMGLFYLLTLFCFVRSADSPVAWRWQAGAVVACALGMATKEVMVTAPLMVLLCDRTFVAGTFGDALRRRRRLYLALAATWIVPAVLLGDAGARGIGTARDVTGTVYALTECRAVVQYLALSFWPHPLVLDRGMEFLRTWSDAALYALMLAPLVAATLWALRRRPAAGFVGAWFFGILATTSSVVPVVFLPMAENRAYLSLAAPVVLVVFALHTRLGRRLFVAAIAVLATGCGLLTARRNRDFASDLVLWADTVAKVPGNPHARYNYGLALSRAGQNAAAAAQWLATLRDEPADAPAHVNLANALVNLGRAPAAVPHYEAALRLRPFFPAARANFGLVLLYLGRVREAAAQLRLAVKQGPDNPSAHVNYGLALERLGDPAAAVAHYEIALRLDPDSADAHHNLGLARARAGDWPAAIAHFESVVRLRPASEDAHLNLVRMLLQAGRLPQAQAAAEAALARFPGSADAHVALGNVLALQGQLPAAATEFERALKLKPDLAAARDNLAIVRARMR